MLHYRTLQPLVQCFAHVLQVYWTEDKSWSPVCERMEKLPAEVWQSMEISEKEQKTTSLTDWCRVREEKGVYVKMFHTERDGTKTETERKQNMFNPWEGETTLWNISTFGTSQPTLRRFYFRSSRFYFKIEDVVREPHVKGDAGVGGKLLHIAVHLLMNTYLFLTSLIYMSLCLKHYFHL